MSTVPTAEPLLETELPDVDLIHRGKVRDVYGVGDELLLVATDRISAFDVVLPGGVRAKGTVLTQLSCFWFDRLQHVVDNQLISADVDEFPDVLQPYADQLAGRSMYARRAERFDVECVVRGYLIGSGWRDYQRTGQGLWHRIAAWPAAGGAAPRADLHALHQSRLGPRRECVGGSDGRADWAGLDRAVG